MKCVVLTCFVLLIGSQDLSTKIFQTEGVAIKGYDPVAYFSKGEAQMGNDSFQYQWSNATWLFSSAENRDLFKVNPEKYAPQYGGHCAWGMREGYKAESDPKKAWHIFHGKLYLNYDKSVQKGWIPEKEENISAANENWSTFSHASDQ